jgi:tetratricopeptide (TPR) repeat protein
MNHAKKARVVMSAAVLAVVATATVSCSTAAVKSGSLASTTRSQSKATQVTALLNTGSAQAERKNWSGATATFQNVLSINPGNVYANYDLGVVAQETSKVAAAIGYYTEALAGNSAYTPAMYNEAILLEGSQPLRALRMYQEIVKINPKAATAYLRMALLQAGQGDLANARANRAKAVSLDSALGKYSLPVKQ